MNSPGKSPFFKRSPDGLGATAQDVLDDYSTDYAQGSGNFRIVGAFKRSSFILGCLCTASGLIVLIGWLVDTLYLKLPDPYLLLPVSTAICILLCGASLLYHVLSTRRQDSYAIGKLTAITAAALSLIILGAYAGAWAFDVDQIFFKWKILPLDQMSPLRMAPNSALCLLFSAVALVLLDSEVGRGHRPAQYIAGIPLFLTVAALVGHAYRMPSLTGIYQYSSMALPTAVLIMALSMGILSARPDRGLMAVITSPGAGGIMARHLLPAAFGLPIVLGGLRVIGEHFGWFPPDFGLFLIIMLMIPALFWVIWGTSYQMGRMDTARRLAGEALRDSAERTRSIIDRAYDAFVAVDINGRITDWNRQAEATFGWKRSQVLGRPLAETIIPSELRAAHAAGFDRHRHGDMDSTMLNKRVELRAVHRDGHEFPIELAMFPVGHGDNIALCAFIQDISVRKEHEEEINCLNKALLEQITEAAVKNESLEHLTAELRVARDQAVDTARVKSEFIASVSHEIRTPLSSIIGMTELLLDTPLDKDQERIASTIYSSGTNLLAIINDILDFAKMDARKIELHFEQFSLVELVEEVGQLLATQARSKHLSFITFVDPSIPDRLKGDANRLRQILINLAGNAVKFTESGSVTVFIEPGNISEESVEIRARVSDTGIGISTQALNELFKPFSQAPSKRQYGGTGLGLSICKNLIELMDGRVGVESTPGSGSTFWFSVELERAREHEASIGPLLTHSLRGHAVVLLSPDNVLKEVFLKQVKAFGGTIEHYTSHEEAYKAIFKLENATHKTLVIDSDWGHDKTCDFISVLADEPQLRGTSVVILTAVETRAAISDFINSGATCILFKPFTRNEFVSAIKGRLTLPQLIDDKSDKDMSMFSVSGYSPPPSSIAQDMPLVLLAEDNPALRELTCRQLKKLGYSIHCVADGAEAIKASQTHKYDLILMDCQMPNVDGFESTRQIRMNEEGTKRHTPVIALTASVLPEDRDKCFAAGMDEFLMKPVGIDDIRSLLKRWLGDAAQSITAVEESMEDKRADTSADRTEPLPFERSEQERAEPVDIEWLTTQYGEEAVDEILKTFHEETASLIARLESAASKEAYAEQATIAHQLAGIAAVVGAQTMRSLSHSLEAAAKKSDASSIEQTGNELIEEINSLQSWILENVGLDKLTDELP